jgi:hypothetical protein
MNKLRLKGQNQKVLQIFIEKRQRFSIKNHTEWISTSDIKSHIDFCRFSGLSSTIFKIHFSLMKEHRSISKAP